MNDDVKDESSGFSSLKRLKTERFYKYTMFSYRSTMKSIEVGDFNLCVREEDIKSLNMAIMPSDFHDKISSYF
jgi:exonuclease III